jgi:hypothetical protein
MMKFAPRFAIVALLFCGCTASRPIFSTTTVVKDDSLPVTPRALEQLPTGRYYRFQMMTTDPSNLTSYVGKIVRVDGDSVELTDVDREGRTHRKVVPLLADLPIPAFRRMFTNTGVGVEILEGNKTLSRSEITAMELLTPAQVDHRLAIKQRVPKSDESAEPAAETEHVATQQDQGWHAAG